MQIVKPSVLTSIIIVVAVFWWVIPGSPEGHAGNQAETKNQPKSHQNPAVPQLTGKLDPQHYFVANSTIWQLINGVFLGAMIETRRNPADTHSPSSRITIKNLTSNTILYEKDLDSSPNFLYVRNLIPDLEPELIVDLGVAASSSNQFQIFAVNPSTAQLILNESYTRDATLIDIDGEAVDVLITTGEAQTAQFKTTLYRFEGDQYRSAGVVPFDKMKRLIDHQLKLKTGGKRGSK
jgi:hypothetical protein